jgi:hypothetical protein
VDVDAKEVSPGVMALTVQDDGFGMHRGQLQNMLSFGFSSKEHVVGNVGRFGIGFKSGSMRLANDALILTRQEDTASVALLSTTFLNAIDADDILIPMFTWTVEPGSSAGKHTYVAHTPGNTAEWEENMGVLEEYTYLKSEQAVLAELDKIDTVTVGIARPRPQIPGSWPSAPSPRQTGDRFQPNLERMRTLYLPAYKLSDAPCAGFLRASLIGHLLSPRVSRLGQRGGECAAAPSPPRLPALVLRRVLPSSASVFPPFAVTIFP